MKKYPLPEEKKLHRLTNFVQTASNLTAGLLRQLKNKPKKLQKNFKEAGPKKKPLVRF